MVRNVHRRNVLKGVGVAGIAGVAGCLGGESDADAMVGVLQPATGDLGNLGEPIMNAGMLPGTQLEDADIDYEIEMRSEDTESDADVAVEQAQSLVDAGFPAITGAAASPSTINAAQDVFYPNEVVAISPASTDPDITEMDGDYLLRTAPSDAWQGEAMAEIAYEEVDAETLSTFYLNNDYGQGLSDTIVENFESLGGEVLDEVSFEAEQPSYSSALENVFGNDPEIVVVIGYPESGEQIFRDYDDDIDDGTPIMVPDGLQDADLPQNADASMDNVLGTAPAAGGPEQDFFVDLFEEEYGSSPGVFTAQAYDATAVLILAQIAAGETDGAAVAEHVREVANPGGEVVGPSNLDEAIEMVDDGEEVQYQGASSVVEFDDNGDMQSVVYEIFEFHEEGYDVTDTVEFES